MPDNNPPTPWKGEHDDGRMNAVKGLVYARGRDLDRRLDGRGVLARGWRGHRDSLLAVFGVASLADLPTLEEETLIRLAQRRLIRELAWHRVADAIERDDPAGFDREVARFQQAVGFEEATEQRFEERARRYREERTASPSLRDILDEHQRAQERQRERDSTESPSVDEDAQQELHSEPAEAAHNDERRTR